MGPRLKDVEDGGGIASVAERIFKLQWGHVSRTWKTWRSVSCPINSTQASMGPRLKDVEDDWWPSPFAAARSRFNGATSQGRGRLSEVLRHARDKTRFNGATSQGRGRQQHGCDGNIPPKSFNGATSQGRGRLGPFTLGTLAVNASMGPRLKDVEDGRVVDTDGRGDVASMGPRLKDVEDASAHHRSKMYRSCFNGATSQGRGRPVHHSRGSSPPSQLQWGHVSRTWKTSPIYRDLSSADLLQWGHVSRTWKTLRSR